MKLRRFICVILALALILITFNACGSTPAAAVKSESAATSSEVAAAPVPADLKASIIYWSHNNPAFVASTKKVIDSFKTVYPNITVNYQNFPYDILMQKMKTAYAAKNEPDIIQGFGAWMPTYWRNDLLAPVPADIAAELTAKLYKAATDGYTYKGKLYGIPLEVNVEYGVYYYPDSLKKAGAEKLPATFAEFRELAKKMTEFDANGNMLKAGFDFFNSDGNFFLTFDWIKQQGGDYLAADGIHLNIATPEAEKVWNTFVEMATTDKITNIKRITAQDAIESLFFKKRAASMFKGPWAWVLAAEYKNTEYIYAVTPTFAGDKPLFVCEPGWGNVVSARSKALDASWALCNYFVKTENAMEWALGTGTIPAQVAVAEDPGFLANPNNATIKDAFPMMQYAVAVGPVTDTDFVKATFVKYIQRAIEGTIKVPEALKSAQDEINKHIDELLAQ